ncbi:MAG: branched-chain amino acid ABC transporter permease [Micromonosporaceae bacterium]
MNPDSTRRAADEDATRAADGTSAKAAGDTTPADGQQDDSAAREAAIAGADEATDTESARTAASDSDPSTDSPRAARTADAGAVTIRRTDSAAPAREHNRRLGSRHQRLARIAAGLALLALLAAPWTVDQYTISTGSRMLVMGLLAMSVTLLTGFAGLPSLAQAAYFGIGAYTAALLARSGMVIGPVQIVAAALIATIIAVLTGSVVVRTRGVTFLMLTLAVGELAHSAAVQWRGITGSTDGLTGIPSVVPLPGMAPLVSDGLLFYYVLAVFLLLFLLVGVAMRSPYGLALRGIRDNEDRMRAAGYPVYRYLLAGYGGAGALAGAAGALWVSVLRYVSPGDLSFGLAALALLAAVIGGTGSMWGACVGAAVVVLVRDYVSGAKIPFTDHVASGPLLLGVTFVVVVYLLPRGIAGIRLPGLRRTKASRTEATGEQP